MMKRYVLDANALLSFVNDEQGAEPMQQFLASALRDDNPLLISVVNWGEVFYVLWERRGEEAAKRAMGAIARLPVEVVPADILLISKAAEIKSLHKIPYANSIAAALAELQQAILITSDHDFQKLGRRIKLHWLPRS